MNQRGHTHDLASAEKRVIPILLYSSRRALPEGITATKHHISKRAGFVHILELHDYCNLCHTLALPSELIAYFGFRQDLLIKFPNKLWEEPRSAAQFISNTHEPLSQPEVKKLLQEAANDTATFDVSPILRRFGDKVKYLPGSGKDLDYYRILAEFSRMTRAEMRGFKRLLKWALEMAGHEPVQMPARMKLINGAGLVVIPTIRVRSRRD